MDDVFLSYARPNRATAHRLADAIEAAGYIVWWDPELVTGENFRREIALRLHAAKCVLVLWSEVSIVSDWVIDEADDARKRGVLLQAIIEPVKPPHGFRGYQIADLSAWNGANDSPELVSLFAGIARLVTRSKDLSAGTVAGSAAIKAPKISSSGVRNITWAALQARYRTMSRRQVLIKGGLSLLGIGSVAWAASIRKLRSEVTRFLPRGIRPNSHTKHPSRDRRLAKRRLPIWDERQFVLNVSAVKFHSNRPVIGHWPHPAISRCRYQVAKKNQELWPVSQMEEALAKYPGSRVNRKQGGMAFELLALNRVGGATLSIDPRDDGTMNRLSQALAVLEKAKLLKCASRRTYELAARLICLLHKDDAAAAADAARAWFVDSGLDDRWRAAFLEQSRFMHWHKKTTDASPHPFVNRLQTRVRRARETVAG